MNPTETSTADAQAAPLVARLVQQHGARWIDAGNHDAFAAGAGDRVLFLTGDAVRFPESLDVAVVLPELQAALRCRWPVGVVVRRDEEAIARRWGNQRWPALVFLRDGRYVATIAGMHDWDDYLARVRAALQAEPSRVPGVGIPVVAAGAGANCH